jgi:hypothetical protein
MSLSACPHVPNLKIRAREEFEKMIENIPEFKKLLKDAQSCEYEGGGKTRSRRGHGGKRMMGRKTRKIMVGGGLTRGQIKFALYIILFCLIVFTMGPTRTYKLVQPVLTGECLNTINRIRLLGYATSPLCAWVNPLVDKLIAVLNLEPAAMGMLVAAVLAIRAGAKQVDEIVDLMVNVVLPPLRLLRIADTPGGAAALAAPGGVAALAAPGGVDAPVLGAMLALENRRGPGNGAPLGGIDHSVRGRPSSLGGRGGRARSPSRPSWRG